MPLTAALAPPGPENPAAPGSPDPRSLLASHRTSASGSDRLRARPPKLCDAASSHPRTRVPPPTSLHDLSQPHGIQKTGPNHDVHDRNPNQAPQRGPGSHHHPGARLGHHIPRQADRSRGQHEHPAQGHHRDGARRPCQPPGTGLHPRQPRPLLHRARHAAECAHVQEPQRPRPRCRPGERPCDGQQGQGERPWWEVERRLFGFITRGGVEATKRREAVPGVQRENGAPSSKR